MTVLAATKAAHLSQESVDTLQRLINTRKLQRHCLSEAEINAEAEATRGAQYLSEYMDGLTLGEDLPVTELQPADDLVLLSAHAFVSAWSLGGSEDLLYNAVTLLEFGLSKSRMSFLMRMMLIRIYRILGPCVEFTEIYLSITDHTRCPCTRAGTLSRDECQAGPE